MKPFVKLIFDNIFKDMVVKVKVKQQPTKMEESEWNRKDVQDALKLLKVK